MKPGGEEKAGGDGCDCNCRCSLPSLGQLQKKFLTLISELFYKHGKFVSYTKIKTSILSLSQIFRHFKVLKSFSTSETQNVKSEQLTLQKYKNTR